MKQINIIDKFLKFFFLGSLLLWSGCTSVMEKAGQALDGSAFAETRINLYRGTAGVGFQGAVIEAALMESKTGERSVIITLNNFPMMKLRGSAPELATPVSSAENGSFFLTSLEYLAGSTHGWNEFTLDLLGEGKLILAQNPSIIINKDIEQVQISAGRIQRFDTRITGSDAVTALRNRHERITSLVEWMHAVETGVPNHMSITGFEKHWKPLLFPELARRRDKPDGWLLEGDQFVRTDDIRWNISYTERTFPEELWPVRNSATMLRDWEEALSWIYMKYQWGNIVNLLSHQITLNKVR